MIAQDEQMALKLRSQPSRRDFLTALGAGLMIAVSSPLLAQERPQRRGRGRGGFGGSGAKTAWARVHIARDGTITVMTGKVECGQGARAELTQAAAEELCVSPQQLQLIMADTSLVPDDGGTFGSMSTPRSVPAIRQGCAAARQLLTALAAQRWNVDPQTLTVAAGKIADAAGRHSITYADLAAHEDLQKTLAAAIPQDVQLRSVESWRVMGASLPRPNARDIVTGSHQYPSDIIREGMLYGRVLRPPSFGAKLLSVDLNDAKALKDVIVVQDGQFVGVAAATSFLAEKAIELLAAKAKWDAPGGPSSAQLFDYLRTHARGGVPANPFADELQKAHAKLAQSYHVAYVQHCPMEPRAAVAEWNDSQLTVWTGTQVPFGVRGELAGAFNLPEDHVRVIVPDMGGGFGGKHSGECAVEAARLAKAVNKPVHLRWTRQEEFTGAYFRPAALIDAQASLDQNGMLTSWYFVNVNSGGNAVQTPYRITQNDCRFVGSEPPLRHGSYRALAATANTFGRECFMDELAAAAKKDPLEFRLAHLDNDRLRAVLQEATAKFGWEKRATANGQGGMGVGLACGTEKGSYAAACAQVAVDRASGSVRVLHICQAFECGKIVNPANLTRQVTGAIIMGLGPILREQMKFDGGKILNPSFSEYRVPRFADVGKIEVHLLDRPDLPSAGAGETPIIAVAPAVANAVYAATGTRVRSMPMDIPGNRPSG